MGIRSTLAMLCQYCGNMRVRHGGAYHNARKLLHPLQDAAVLHRRDELALELHKVNLELFN